MTRLETTIFNDRLEKPFIEDCKNFGDYVKKVEKYVSKLENKNVESNIIKAKNYVKRKQKKINKNIKKQSCDKTYDFLYISFEDVYKINSIFKFLSFEKLNTKTTTFNEISYYYFLNIFTIIITKKIQEKEFLLDEKDLVLDEDEKQFLLDLSNENLFNKVINIDVLIDFFASDDYENFFIENRYDDKRSKLIYIILKLAGKVIHYCLNNNIQPVDKTDLIFIK